MDSKYEVYEFEHGYELERWFNYENKKPIKDYKIAMSGERIQRRILLVVEREK